MFIPSGIDILVHHGLLQMIYAGSGDNEWISADVIHCHVSNSLLEPTSLLRNISSSPTICQCEGAVAQQRPLAAICVPHCATQAAMSRGNKIIVYS